MVDPIKIGVGGPIGAGKTQLIEKLVRRLSKGMSIGVVTSDVYAKGDQKILVNIGVLPEDRVIGVGIGGRPHTAIRENTSMSFTAIDELLGHHEDIELISIGSGSDNSAATLGPELADFSIYIIDVAQGEEIPRKGGQGMTKSDYFVINKTNLAEFVGASLGQMAEDIKIFHDNHPFIFTNLKTDDDLDNIIEWIEHGALLRGLA